MTLTPNRASILGALDANPQEFKRPSVAKISILSGVANPSSVNVALAWLEAREYINDNGHLTDKGKEELERWRSNRSESRHLNNDTITKQEDE